MMGKGNKSSSNPQNVVHETHLSGAYIRSLVKQQLSSCKDPQNSGSRNGTGFVQQKPHLPHSKPARRRLHTSKPYQEKLLNMAEARREIVAALKSHRASMKQGSDEKQNQQKQLGLGIIDQASSGFDSSSAQVVQENSNLDTAISSVLSSSSLSGNSGLHQSMDDKDLEEIRSIGERYQIEWNDIVNLSNSARWSEFLEVMEIEPEHGISEEFPAWFNANENDDYYYNFADPTLPW